MAGSLWERVTRVLRREARDAGVLAREAQERLDRELGRRERELAATPEERLQASIEEIERSDDAFDEVRRRLEGGPG